MSTLGSVVNEVYQCTVYTRLPSYNVVFGKLNVTNVVFKFFYTC